MTTLATITAVIAVFAVVQVQEWRQLTRTNRYAVKLKHHNDVMLSKARANERRKAGVA